VDSSLRRRGQVLVITGALLGAVAGAALGLVGERAEAPGAIGAAALGRGASGVAAGSPSSRPSSPQATRPRSQAGDGLSEQRPNPLDQADRRGDKARKHSSHDRGKPGGRGKGKHGKGM
jgi:hypothetical protein